MPLIPDYPPTRPTIPEVLPLVRALYAETLPCSFETGRVGGHLHVVLDDGNISDGMIEACLRDAQQENCTTCARIASLLLQMTPTQRRKISRIHYIR